MSPPLFNFHFSQGNKFNLMLKKPRVHEWSELFCKGLGGVKKSRVALEKEKWEKEIEALKKEGVEVDGESPLSKPVPKVSDGKQVSVCVGGVGVV